MVLGTMLVLGTTGIIRWIWEDTLAKDTLSLLIGIHVVAAYVMDISFIYHFGRKLLFRAVRRTRQIFRDAYTVKEQPKPLPSLVSREGEP